MRAVLRPCVAARRRAKHHRDILRRQLGAHLVCETAAVDHEIEPELLGQTDRVANILGTIGLDASRNAACEHELERFHTDVAPWRAARARAAARARTAAAAVLARVAERGTQEVEHRRACRRLPVT